MMYSGPDQTFGGVLRHEPLITISKSAPFLQQLLGFSPLIPDFADRGPSLHFVGIVRSIEPKPVLERLVAALAAARRKFPKASYVVLANTEYESFLLSQRSVPCLLANELMFTDHRRFRVVAAEGPVTYDAVYNAQFYPFKRHELAVSVPRLLLLYKMPSEDDYAKMRQLLPGATFGNHDRGPHRRLSPGEISALYARCGAGLCLSAFEGAMRVSMEYLLCGLPVVTTQSIGGRDRYFAGSHAFFAEPNPASVARTVQRALENAPPRDVVRTHMMEILNFERTNFLRAVNRIAQSVFATNMSFQSIDPFLDRPIRPELLSRILAKFNRASDEPTAIHAS